MKMNLKNITATLMLSLTALRLSAQEPSMSIVLLDNESIADVNLEARYVDELGNFVNLIKSSFKNIPASQQIALLVEARPDARSAIRLFADPPLAREKEQAFLKDAAAFPLLKSRFADFPVLIRLNGDTSHILPPFVPVTLRKDSLDEAYATAPLHVKYELLRDWAAREVLPVLSSFEKKADASFEGVVNTGNKVFAADFSKPQPVAQFTSSNPDYWRGMMEMGAGNHLVVATRIFALVAQGQLDYARQHVKVVLPFSDKQSVAGQYLMALDRKLTIFFDPVHNEIERGIAAHDREHYKQAIGIYEALLAQYPQSAWALYERYYSTNAQVMGATKGRVHIATWKAARPAIFKADPMYATAAWAENAEEAYLLQRRSSATELFQDSDKYLDDLFSLGDIALDIGVYDYAAHVFWLCATYDKDKQEAALHRYLYCLERLGVTKLKELFQGDFPKIFKQIDEDRRMAMERSEIYQSMNKEKH